MTINPDTRPSLNGAPLAMLCLVAAVLCLSAFGLSAMHYENLLLFGEIGVLGGLALFACFRWPQAGIVVVILSGLFVPLQVSTGTKTGLNIPFLLAPVLVIFWLLWMMNQRHSASWTSSGSIRPLVLFLVVSMVSTVVAQFQRSWRSPAPLKAQLGGLAILLFSGGIFFVSAHVLRDHRWLRRITYLFLIAGAVRVLLMLIPGLEVEQTMMFSTIGPLGSMFWTWLTALAFSQAIANRELKMGYRLAAAILVVAILYLTIAQWHEWASGWLPSCIAILVVLALRARALLATVIALAGAAAVVNLQAIIRFFWTPDQIISYTTRLAMAESLFHTITLNPLLGSGPANYNHYLHFNSHNNYLDILVETGMLGLLSLLWFLVALVRTCFRMRNFASEGFAEAYVCGVSGGLAGTICVAALGDWFLPFAYNIGVIGFRTSILAWIFLGGLIALEHSTRVDQSHQPAWA